MRMLHTTDPLPQFTDPSGLGSVNFGILIRFLLFFLFCRLLLCPFCLFYSHSVLKFKTLLTQSPQACMHVLQNCNTSSTELWQTLLWYWRH